MPGCFPYLEGCTSVSATGRYGWSYFLFKGGLLPSATLIALYWWLVRNWLLATEGRATRAANAILVVGLAAAAFLALYALFLGHKGDTYNLLRRFGVTCFFGFSYLAHLLLLWRVGRMSPRTVSPRLYRAQTVLAAGLLVLGLGSIPVSNFGADSKAIINAIEWTFCILLQMQYLLTWAAWRATGFRLEARVAR